MSDELFHVRHSLALSSVLAVPAVPVEENEVHESRPLIFFFDAEDTLHRGAFSADQGRILFCNPHPSFSLRLPFADLLLGPPFYRQRNSLAIQHLLTRYSESLRALIITISGWKNQGFSTKQIYDFLTKLAPSDRSVPKHFLACVVRSKT